MKIQPTMKSKQTVLNADQHLLGRRCRGLMVVAMFCATILSPKPLFAGDGGPKLTVGQARQVQVQFPGQSNRVYQIQASTDLTNWTVISQRAGSNGTVTIMDSQAAKFPTR
ncbi:MAG TPA: hypothetical protein VH598_12015, partial [Verrucomicrobiae bacterium]|nr:hypothetical protein [Verrucomicrobiae bacterium]